MALPVIILDASGNIISTFGGGNVDGSGNMIVVGNVANDAVDSGNPVKIGGKANTSPPTAVTVGDRVDVWLTTIGQQVIAGLSTQNFADNSTFNVNGWWRSDGGASNLAGVVTGLFQGTGYDRARTPNVFKTVSLAAGTAETTIWTPAGGKKFRLMGFILSCGAASTLTFKDNTAGTTIFIARGTIDQPISPNGMGNGILSAAANNVLTVTRGTSATLDGTLFVTEE